MINNRQNGRRRGRGGNQRPGGGGGQGQRDSGNRIDSRARGNAAQLLEKYRNMARDAQMSGDRVNTEYYLQFADHYFRVLADQRGRNDDQPMPRHLRNDLDQFDDSDDFGDEGEPIRSEDQVRASEGDSRPRRDERPRSDRDDRPRTDRDDRQRDGRQRDDRQRDDRQRDDRPRSDERQRDNRHDGRGEHRNGYAERNVERAEPRVERDADTPVAAAPVVEAAAAEEARTPRRRTRKPREEAAGEQVAFDIDRLPPSLGVSAAPAEPAADAPAPASAADTGEEAPKPRRRRVRTAVEATPAE
ncbi:DUF4167 domain-containing protein [Sphingomonas adhaesiva]|uniref:DUF4167 domain-containing protein n=1 Tax=Sphingomonas adhaesiva TaxID=28212 RepID=UPI002FF7F6DD